MIAGSSGCRQQGTPGGVITADDIMDVIEEESTEDIHKLGSKPLDLPYMHSSLITLLVSELTG